FSSQENKDVFKAAPEKYAPQFGGYCAYAVSQGYTYQSSPEAWKIVDGKLYLNYSKSIQKRWEANQSEFIKNAESNWPKINN
ncbi:MAG: YHS domain-containing (seleno)protein, partial [Bacteroidota bacterium]